MEIRKRIMSLFLLVIFLFSSILNSFPHTHHSHSDKLQIEETHHSHSHHHHHHHEHNHHCLKHHHHFDSNDLELDLFTSIINNHSHSSENHSHSNMITQKPIKHYSLVYIVAFIIINFDYLLSSQDTFTTFNYIPCLNNKIYTKTFLRRGPPLNTYYF